MNILSNQILSQLKNKSPQTASDLFEKGPYRGLNVVTAMLFQLSKKGFVSKEKVFNPTNGKWPWTYTITPKGRRYLSLRLQLKALLHERE